MLYRKNPFFVNKHAKKKLIRCKKIVIKRAAIKTCMIVFIFLFGVCNKGAEQDKKYVLNCYNIDEI